MLNFSYPAELYLNDGTLYKGWSFFENTISSGEIVFNTGMTGYQEIMTDPSYSGQIIVFTYPELGNTGLNLQDCESNYIHVKGIIAKNICLSPSNWRSLITLKEYILKKQIPHIFGIDTRALTKHLRFYGVMLGYISNKGLQANYINSYVYNLKLDLVKRVTTSKVYYLNSNISYSGLTSMYLNKNTSNALDKNFRILLINFGVKSSIIYRLLAYGCNVYVVPATVNYEIVTKYQPDGIVLSNGPGDPASLISSISMIKKIVHFSNIPILGICMGHQLLNIALGASTFKLKFGHRGLNHPSGIYKYSEITSQNHGFAVQIDKSRENSNFASEFVTATHLNLNDLTLGGIVHNTKPIFSVQHHPEASPGPHDSDYLFRAFVDLIDFMKSKKLS
uniref:Carbamoyl phosphate synthase small chain n=1 Tax=Nitophyllum punctatum TaxID=158729 RepID=A0A4D6WY11_9FLOR|nr:Carbamoyl phosphate synthase small subunit [Nitophyllum punctatum]